jgi:phosphoesterase RecJ-like protein
MIQRITELITKHQKFLIVAHERPDGDAVGSTLAFYHILRGLGKDAVIYNQDRTPENFVFLPGSDTIVRELPAVETFEVAVVLDCGDLDRVGRDAAAIGGIARFINIDHHVSNREFSAVRLIDTDASSTGELIYRLMREMRVPLTKDISTCLYTAILTDTGGFHYGNTRCGSLRAAADMVECGAEPQWISENIFEADHPGRLRLLGLALPTMTIEEDGRLGSMVVTQRALAEAGALSEHSEGFVDFPRSIRGVEVSILYSELEDGRFKLSLRSKGTKNVERVARMFGGGGHVNAAGCRIVGELDDIRRRVGEAVRTYVFGI